MESGEASGGMVTDLRDQRKTNSKRAKRKQIKSKLISIAEPKKNLRNRRQIISECRSADRESKKNQKG